ncbi:MAG: DegV family protein [Ignavibacteriales bacterium]
MHRVKVVVDSTCDLPRELRESLGITMVPLRVHFDPEVYLDHVDLTPAEFYDKLGASKVHPRTSQPSPAEFAEVYRRLGADGSSIVSIHLSANLSGTYQSSVLGKSMAPGVDVEVMDSRSACLGTGLMAMAAAKVAAEGKGAAEVVETANRVRENLVLYFVVDTLEYLRRNGRIGRAQHLLGSLLQFKPILTIDDEGFVTSFDKARGKSRAFSRLLEIIRERLPEGGDIVLAVAHAKASEDAEKLVSEVGASYNIREKVIAELGPVIGTHVGPGTVAVICYDASKVWLA